MLPELQTKSFFRPDVFILYKTLRINTTLMDIIKTKAIREKGELGFFIKKKNENEEPFLFENLFLVECLFSINGYSDGPTFFSNYSIFKEGPFTVFDAKTKGVSFKGFYKYDAARRAHTIDGAALPLGCSLTRNLIFTNAEAKVSAILRLNATIYKAILLAIKTEYSKQGNVFPEYTPIETFARGKHFWQFSQKVVDGAEVFFFEQGAGQDAFVAPEMLAKFCESPPESIRELRTTIAKQVGAAKMNETTQNEAKPGIILGAFNVENRHSGSAGDYSKKANLSDLAEDLPF